MGNYFVMSIRFNKCSASDFGFILKDKNTAINPNDNSIWIKTSLYDFGWGKENGFYKDPLPGFDSLFEIALHSTNSEDMYGAAAVILERFASDLLCKCEIFMNDRFRKNEFRKMVELFDLKLSLNRCSVSGKTYEQIQSDSARWETVSMMARSIMGRVCD